MDVRVNRQKPQAFLSDNQTDTKLTDSLIYNIIKKIELKIAMENKYEETRTPQVKELPNRFGKHLHSTNALAYFGFASALLLFLRYKGKSKLKISAFVPHCVIAITINEYERYRNILNVDKEMMREYRSYQQNSALIIAEKRKRLNLWEEIKNSDIVSFERLVEVLKYRPIY